MDIKSINNPNVNIVGTSYKGDKNYNGDDGIELKDITDWHIGGRSDKAVDYVQRQVAIYRGEA